MENSNEITFDSEEIQINKPKAAVSFTFIQPLVRTNSSEIVNVKS